MKKIFFVCIVLLVILITIGVRNNLLAQTNSLGANYNWGSKTPEDYKKEIKIIEGQIADAVKSRSNDRIAMKMEYDQNFPKVKKEKLTASDATEDSTIIEYKANYISNREAMEKRYSDLISKYNSLIEEVLRNMTSSTTKNSLVGRSTANNAGNLLIMNSIANNMASGGNSTENIGGGESNSNVDIDNLHLAKMLRIENRSNYTVDIYNLVDPTGKTVDVITLIPGQTTKLSYQIPTGRYVMKITWYDDRINKGYKKDVPFTVSETRTMPLLIVNK
jgi:hypothetical protein